MTHSRPIVTWSGVSVGGGGPASSSSKWPRTWPRGVSRHNTNCLSDAPTVVGRLRVLRCSRYLRRVRCDWVLSEARSRTRLSGGRELLTKRSADIKELRVCRAAVCQKRRLWPLEG